MCHLYDSCVLESTRATEDPYSDTNSNNYACRGSNPTTGNMLGRGSVKSDLGSTVAGATRLVARASGTTLDGGIRFPGDFSVMTGAFAPD